jgi:hypothetical protein
MKKRKQVNSKQSEFSKRLQEIIRRNRRKEKDKKESPITSAKDTIERRRKESLVELAQIDTSIGKKNRKKTKTSEIPKKLEKVVTPKPEVKSFIERWDLVDNFTRIKENLQKKGIRINPNFSKVRVPNIEYAVKEQIKIKKFEKDLEDNLSEIEKNRLKFLSNTPASISHKKNELPDNYVIKPLDFDMKKSGEKALEKQKKYWG